MRNNVVEIGQPIRKEKIQIDGKTELRDVYRVDIENLYYNDENGRIATYIAEYCANNEVALHDLDINEYNDVIMRFIIKSSVSNKYNITKKDIASNGQLKTGIILSDGRVIDGNRRFSCLRELYKETHKEEYKYFECFILPVPQTQQERTSIKSLELKYQFGEDQREDYNPIDKLVDIYNCLIAKPAMFTVDEYYDRVNGKMTKSQIKISMLKAEVMYEYLEFIGKPKRFDIARDLKLDGPIQEIASLKRSIKDDFEWLNVSYVLYTRMQDITTGDRSRIIRELTKLYKTDRAGFMGIVEQTQELEEDKYLSNGEVTQEIKEKAIKLDKNIETLVAKSNIDQAKKKQIEIVRSANRKLSDVDVYEIEHMPSELTEEFKEELKQLKKVIEKLEGVLNVK